MRDLNLGSWIPVAILCALPLAVSLLSKPVDPTTPLHCAFTGTASTAAIHKNWPRDFSLDGRLRLDRDDKAMGHYEGTASWEKDGKKGTAPAAGIVFLDKRMAVSGLALFIGAKADISQGLEITTLNAEGMLDSNSTQAFLSGDRSDKLGHPVRYACSGA
jgi:hypothetical protein